MTERQGEVLTYLEACPWSTRDEVAVGVGTSIRAAGALLNRLLEAGRLTLVADPADPNGYRWAPMGTPRP